MSNPIQAYAAMQAGGKLEPFTYEPGELGHDEVEIAVQSCGLCHSDLSMIDNEWGRTPYPIVPGHEAIGTVVAKGDYVSHLALGQTVGVGWVSGSCRSCSPCMKGQQHRCEKMQTTIGGHHGGFADRMRTQSIWATPLPKDIDHRTAGPLFCGGITVFSPFIERNILPTDRVAIIGIGGLGHLALQFANAWGCEVIALTSNLDKAEALKQMGAHHVINSRDEQALKQLRNSCKMVLSTVNVPLQWGGLLAALAPEGGLVHVGMVSEPLDISVGQLIRGGKYIAGSDTGSPHHLQQMLAFASRHNIKPVVEYFPMDRINDAIAHLKSGQARYRIVLEN